MLESTKIRIKIQYLSSSAHESMCAISKVGSKDKYRPETEAKPIARYLPEGNEMTKELSRRKETVCIRGHVYISSLKCHGGHLVEHPSHGFVSKLHTEAVVSNAWLALICFGRRRRRE